MLFIRVFNRRVSAFLVALVMLVALAGCSGNGKSSTESPSGGSQTGDTASQETPQDGGQTEQTGGFDVSTAKELNVTMLGDMAMSSKSATEDVLTPIWREKTKVIPEAVSIPEGQTQEQFYQMQSIAGTLPEIIATQNGVGGGFETLMSLKLLREITPEEIYQYMPRTVERLQNWGVSVDQWIDANRYYADGKLYYIPGAPNLMATHLNNEDFVREDNSWGPYHWYFRDDILKMIFPEARTEKELKDFYIENGGEATFDDINDIPIYNLEDLYNYLAKVKELELTVNGNPVIPGQIQFNATAGCLTWSAFSLPGFFWQDYGLNDVDKGKFAYFAATDGWKDYIKWFNRLYNEGLIGKETFIQKDEQRDAKVVNGEYAVFQSWLPVDAARERSIEEDRGYGFRYVGFFYEDDFVNDYQDYTDTYITLKRQWGSIGITNSTKEDDIPQILNWIDWNLSEEANILRAWGLPEFYTGTDHDRRFKDEYKDLEQWSLYEMSGEKDGLYYGMQPYYSSTDRKPETYGIGWEHWRYEYRPDFVYPEDLSNPDSIYVESIVNKAVALRYSDIRKYYLELPLEQDVLDLYNEFNKAYEEVTEMGKTAGFDSDGAQTATIQAIVGNVDDFEANYAAFEKYLTDELMDGISREGDAYLKYMRLYKDKYIQPID